MTITASSKLSDSDVKKMVSDAKEFEEQDKARKEEIETRNTADSLVYTAEKTKADLADKLNADITERLNSAITATKAALEGKDTPKIRSEMENLQKVLGEAGTAAYQHVSQQAQQQAGSQEAPPGEGASSNAPGPDGEKVVDADFKVKDEK